MPPPFSRVRGGIEGSVGASPVGGLVIRRRQGAPQAFHRDKRRIAREPANAARVDQ